MKDTFVSFLFPFLSQSCITFWNPFWIPVGRRATNTSYEIVFQVFIRVTWLVTFRLWRCFLCHSYIFDFVFTVPLSKSKRQNAVFVDLLRVFREYFSFVCLSIVALAFTKFQFAGRSTSSLFIFIKFRWDELSHTLGIKEPSKKDKWAQIGQQ